MASVYRRLTVTLSHVFFIYDDCTYVHIFYFISTGLKEALGQYGISEQTDIQGTI